MNALRITLWLYATIVWAWLSLKVFHQIEPDDFWLAIDALTACCLLTLQMAENLLIAIDSWKTGEK